MNKAEQQYMPIEEVKEILRLPDEVQLEIWRMLKNILHRLEKKPSLNIDTDFDELDEFIMSHSTKEYYPELQTVLIAIKGKVNTKSDFISLVEELRPRFEVKAENN